VHVTRLMNPVQAFAFNFFDIHFNIISHLRLGLSSGFFPSGFHTKTLYAPFLSHMRATCPAHFIRLDFTTIIVSGEEYKSWSSSAARHTICRV
jgi:hypothetical protein